jgi:heme A synthase
VLATTGWHSSARHRAVVATKRLIALLLIAAFWLMAIPAFPQHALGFAGRAGVIEGDTIRDPWRAYPAARLISMPSCIATGDAVEVRQALLTPAEIPR